MAPLQIYYNFMEHTLDNPLNESGSKCYKGISALQKR